MIVYYYIFNRVRNFYISSGEKDVPGLYGLGIVMLLQFLTIFCLVILPERLQFEKFPFDKSLIIIIMLAVLALNYTLIYVFNSPEKINERINNLNKAARKAVIIVSWIHIIFTVGLIVFLACLSYF